MTGAWRTLAGVRQRAPRVIFVDSCRLTSPCLRAAHIREPVLGSRIVQSRNARLRCTDLYSHQPPIDHSAVMPQPPRDLRCGTRVPCDLRVLVMVHPATFGPGVLLNVSISGALLQTPLELNPLTQIELEVEGPGMSRSSIMAYITRRELNEYGVAFRGTMTTTIETMLRLAQSQADAVQAAKSREPARQHHH